MYIFVYSVSVNLVSRLQHYLKGIFHGIDKFETFSQCNWKIKLFVYIS